MAAAAAAAAAADGSDSTLEGGNVSAASHVAAEMAALRQEFSDAIESTKASLNQSVSSFKDDQRMRTKAESNLKELQLTYRGMMRDLKQIHSEQMALKEEENSALRAQLEAAAAAQG